MKLKLDGTTEQNIGTATIYYHAHAEVYHAAIEAIDNADSGAALALAVEDAGNAAREMRKAASLIRNMGRDTFEAHETKTWNARYDDANLKVNASGAVIANLNRLRG